MNRLGFGLLTLGTVLAFLGWHYRDDLFAAPGFVLILALAVLAAAMPTYISYKPERAAAPLGIWELRLWGAYYVFGVVFLIALPLWHTLVAGGHGEYVVLAGIGLIAFLGVYDAFHYDRFRAWRLNALRTYRENRG
jgi:hypothetical protein